MSELVQHLPSIFGEDNALDGPTILDRFYEHASPETAGLLRSEIADQATRWNTYVQLLQRKGRLVSNGRRRGYSLPQNDLAADKPENVTGQIPGQETAVNDGRFGPNSKEAIFHFGFSLLVPTLFETAAVFSFPPSAAGLSERMNPDGFFLRFSESYLAFSDEHEEWNDLVGAVDGSPKLVLGVFELKAMSASQFRRATQIDLLVQTFSNSSWANEAWLIVLITDDGEMSWHPDAQYCAEQLGIGVLIVDIEKIENLPGFRVLQHRSAKRSNKVNFLSEIAEAHKARVFAGINLFLDQDSDLAEPLGALRLALANLSYQRGFRREEGNLDGAQDLNQLRMPSVDSVQTAIEQEGFGFSTIAAGLGALVSPSFNDLAEVKTNVETSVEIARMTAHHRDDIRELINLLGPCWDLR